MVDERFQKRRLTTKDFDCGRTYDRALNELPSLKRGDDYRKVSFIEGYFHWLAWDVEGFGHG